MEILALRHQLLVLQRQAGRPAFTDTDRAVLAGLLHHLPTDKAPPLPAAGAPGHDPALAPEPAPAPARRGLRTEAARTSTDRPLDPEPGPAPGQGEPHLGIPPDPRRTRSARDQGRGPHRLGNPQGARHPTRPGADQHDLGRVPARPSRRPARLRPLRGPDPDRGAPVRLRRHRAQVAPHPNPGRHRSPDRGLDRPTRTQPPHGPRRSRHRGPVPDPRPRREVHGRLRRPDHRRRTDRRDHRHPDPTHGLPHGTLDPDLPARTPGPHADLEPAPSPVRAPRVRELLQPAPAAPEPGTGRTAPHTARSDQRATPDQTPGSPPTRPTRRNTP